MNEILRPEYVYNIKLRYKLPYYPFVAVSPAGSDLCAIKKVSMDPDCFLYGFEDGQATFLERSDYNEPLLHIQEHRNDLNQLTHLVFTIQEWDGAYLGQIVWGSNEYPVWTEDELKGPPGLMVGKTRAIRIKQIRDPVITGLEPPEPPIPPEPTLWGKIPWWGKGIIIGIPALLVLQKISRVAGRRV